MKIVVNGNVIDTENIYCIGQIKIQDGKFFL